MVNSAPTNSANGNKSHGGSESFDLFRGVAVVVENPLLAALFLRHCELYADARCLVVGKSFPGLRDLEAEFRSFFTAVYGTDLKFDGQKHRFTFPNGATVQLDQLENQTASTKGSRSLISPIDDEAGRYASPNLIDG